MRIAVAVLTTIVAAATAVAAPSAEQLFDEGQGAFDRGEYAIAIARWQSSYELSKLPLLVLNVGQAYRLAGDCARALSAYQRYSALDPMGEQRNLAAGFVAELSAQCGPLSQPHERVTENPSPRSVGHDMKSPGFLAGGVGVAAIATGLLFGRRATSLGDEVTRDCSTACDWSVERTKQSDGQRDATVGKVLDVVGVAALAAGIGLFVYGARGDEPALTIQPHSTGATVSWGGRW